MLVPLSKMNVRVCFSAVLDFPLTVIPGESSCQKPDDGSVRDANVRLPACGQQSAYPRGRKTTLPVNLEESVPPRVSSAPPSASGVRRRLNKVGRPFASRPANSPLATDDMPRNRFSHGRRHRQPTGDGPPWIPLNGSAANVGVWFVMRNRLTFGTLTPPTLTVSFALRSVSCQLSPMTGSTPTPVPKVIVLERPPSTKVLLFVASNFVWCEHAAPQRVPGDAREGGKRRDRRGGTHWQTRGLSCLCRTRR